MEDMFELVKAQWEVMNGRASSWIDAFQGETEIDEIETILEENHITEEDMIDDLEYFINENKESFTKIDELNSDPEVEMMEKCKWIFMKELNNDSYLKDKYWLFYIGGKEI